MSDQDDSSISADQVIEICTNALVLRANCQGYTASIQLERALDAAANACYKYNQQQLDRIFNTSDYIG